MNANSNLQYLDLFCLPRYERKFKPSRPMAALVLAMASNDQTNDQSETSCLKVYWVVCNVHGCSLILYKRNLGPFFNCPTTSAIGLTIQVPKILKSPPCLARCITFLSLSSITYQIGNQPPKQQLPKKPWTFNVLVLRRSPTQRPFVASSLSLLAAAQLRQDFLQFPGQRCFRQQGRSGQIPAA